MSYQLCPKCKGEKVIQKFGNLNAEYGDCDICEGTGFLNEFNGMPPGIRVIQKQEERRQRQRDMISILTKDLTPKE